MNRKAIREMKVVVINGSPRKNFNTATLLQRAMDGIEQAGGEVQYENLYEYDFTGCRSCFACKVKGSKTNGLCAIRDGIRPLLEACLQADALLFGSPIYYDNISGMMRSFLERLWYPLDANKMDENRRPVKILNRTIPVGFIYTMNCPEWLREQIYSHLFNSMQNRMMAFFGSYEPLFSCDTYQFKDYSKYDANMFDEKKKAEQREKQFPIDCQKAFQLGVKLVKGK